MIYNLIKNIQKHIAEQRAKHALKSKPKGIVPPYQLPMVYNEIKLEELKMQDRIGFEEIKYNDISKEEALKLVHRSMGNKLVKFVNQFNLGCLTIIKDESNQEYRFDFKMFIGVDKRLFDKSIKSIESFKKDKTNKL